MIVIVVPLVAVRYDNRVIMTRQILDESGGSLDDICIQPEDPGGCRAEGGEEEAVPGAGHALAPSLLVLELVALFFILGLQRGLEVLAEDADAGEAGGDGPVLRLADG